MPNAEYVSDADCDDDVEDIDNRVVTVQCVDNLIAPFGCFAICTICTIWRNASGTGPVPRLVRMMRWNMMTMIKLQRGFRDNL